MPRKWSVDRATGFTWPAAFDAVTISQIVRTTGLQRRVVTRLRSRGWLALDHLDTIAVRTFGKHPYEIVGNAYWERSEQYAAFRLATVSERHQARRYTVGKGLDETAMLDELVAIVEGKPR